MSESIDRRVVEMRFDNKDFEQNANTTMQVLEKLKEKLSFKGAGERFENTSGLGGAIESVKGRFSALEIIGTTALVNLTNSAMNLGKQMAKSLTIDQVKAGFSEYELKMNSVNTIMASTGESIQTVNKYLNDLNEYSDQTIYSFSDMTQNIGKFTNAGVKLEDAVLAIKGISNEAAVSGANAQEASRAMYNFAQALSAGSVKLIDWKSIENANMATVEFKQQLLDTAVALGTVEKSEDGYVSTTQNLQGKVSDIFTTTKGFNESLAHQWMTTDVLTQTLKNYSVDLAKMTDEQKEAWREQMRSTGYTDEQIKKIEILNKKAYDAATQFKSFSQMMDALKESVGSGWAQTFELIFGNLEQAKRLWSNVGREIDVFIGRISNARNAALLMWHANVNGRERFFKGLGQMFHALVNFAKPISEAFRNVFPDRTAEKLISFSTRLELFSRSFNDTMTLLGNQLKGPFEDVFKAGRDVLELFGDALKGVFEVITGSGGESALHSVIVLFANFLGMLARGVSAIIAFTRATGIFKVLRTVLEGINDILFGVFDSLFSVGEGLSGVFSGLIGPISKASDSINNMLNSLGGKRVKAIEFLSLAIGKFFSLIGKGLSHLDLGKLGAFLAGGGIMAAGMKLVKFIDTLGEKFEALFPSGEGGEGGIMAGVKETFGSLADTLKQFQTSLKVGQLVTVAIALGILAASCATLADIPAKKLAVAVGAIGGLFTELGIASHLMSGAQTKGIIAMSVAVMILAKAVKSLSEVESMGKGLLGVGAILGELTAFCLIFDKLKIRPKALKKTGEGLILMAVAINLLAKPIKELGAMDTGQLIQGLLAMAAMLGGFTLTALAFSKIKTKGLVKAGAAMVVMAAAMQLLVKPLSELGAMNLPSLAKGLGAMGVALLELAGFTAIMSKIAASTGNIMKVSAALLVMSIGIKIMANAITQMGMDSGAGQGLSVMFGALIILAGAMALMQNSVAGAAAMVIVAGALAIMAPSIALLSSLNLMGVVTALVALAGTLAVFGVGAALLAPLIPVMIGLAAAMTLLGVGVLSLGAGMTLLVAAFSMATGPIINGAQAIAQAFPIIAKGIGDGIIAIITIIGDSAKTIADTFKKIVEAMLTVFTDVIPDLVTVGLQLILALLNGINSNIGQITEVAISIITNFINALSDGLPDLVDAGFNLMISLLNSMADAISDNADSLKNALANVLLAALGAIVNFIPGFGKKGKEAIDEYRKGFEDKGTKSKIDKTAETISKDTDKKLEIPDQYSNGTNAGQGLINGLKAMEEKAYQAGYNLGSASDRGVKAGSGVHSPSWKTFKTGGFIVQGLVNGMQAMSNKAESSASNIATRVIGSYNNALDWMNPFSETIVPSFDMSKVNQQVASIDASFSRAEDPLANMVKKLSNSLDSMTDTMNSRALNNYITVDGATDPNAFADDLIRSFRLNARTV